MDPIYYTRIAMAGWVFVVLFGLSIVECGIDIPLDWLKDTEDITKDITRNIVLVIVSLIVGIGSPPAFGFILEKIGSLFLWWTNLGMWKYECVQQFQMPDDSINAKASIISGPPAFHIYFYKEDNKLLLDWTRRRKTHIVTSLTSSIAIIIYLIIFPSVFHKFPVIVGFSSILLCVLLFWHSVREAQMHKEVICAWIKNREQDNVIDSK